MRICILTQTATDIPDYYKDFFRDKDLFFITFKKHNAQAIAFMPNSTFADGRNRLWEEVKGEYDYYIFIDDDLQFFKPKISFTPLATYLSHKLLYRGHIKDSYELATPNYFFSHLQGYLEKYQPEVLAGLGLGDTATRLDMAAMRKNSFVRRLGYFDGQITVLSNYAASKLIPYDTKFSGWWSPQIPIFLYTFHVFGLKALAISDIAVVNTVKNGVYVPNYDGLQDCKNMLSAISDATGKDFNQYFRQNTAVVNFYGEKEILKRLPQPEDKENYAENFEHTLKGIETVLHKNMGFPD
ncbi:MAG: hypothetical protein EOO61_10235 [Hymenobacter sp.]|nr:MAG: hypothetical protein EOO61_10235 [Hymenobacter sp.]